VRISVAAGGSLRVGRCCRLGDGCRLVVCSGRIELGAGSTLGEGCTLIARREITIAESSRLGDGVSILDFGPAPIDTERPIRGQPLHVAAVVLGPGVEVGLRAALGPGVRLPASARVEPGVVLGGLAAPLLRLVDPVSAGARAGGVVVDGALAGGVVVDGASGSPGAGRDAGRRGSEPGEGAPAVEQADDEAGVGG
jgi:acetyltransferase-like isoleucine patch superfamily enzyme